MNHFIHLILHAATASLFATAAAACTSIPETLIPGNTEIIAENSLAPETLDATWKAQRGRNAHTMCSHTPENVTCREGSCRLAVTRKSGKWLCGSMISQRDYLYGYFEAEITYAKSPGINNAFWLRSLKRPDGEFCELDINEGHYPNQINTNIHTHLPSLRTLPEKLTTHLSLHEEKQRYGILWSKEEIVWYMNRKVIRRIPNDHCHYPMRLRASVAVTNWAGPTDLTRENDGMTVSQILIAQPKE